MCISYTAKQTMKLVVGAHDTNTVQHKCQQNPFHPTSWKMFAPMTSEYWQMPVDLMTSVLSTPIRKAKEKSCIAIIHII